MSWPRIPSQNFKSEEEEFHEMLLYDVKNSGIENLKSLGLRKHRYIQALFHQSYHEAFSDPKTQSKIYESFITVTKALDYFKNHYGTARYGIHLFIPIVVLDGTLWSASIKNKKGNIPHSDKLSLKNVDGLLVKFNRLTPFSGEPLFFEEEQIIEVITRKAFRKKMAELERDDKELYRCWTNFINL